MAKKISIAIVSIVLCALIAFGVACIASPTLREQVANHKINAPTQEPDDGTIGDDIVEEELEVNVSKFEVLKKGDELSYFAFDFDADIDYESLVKDVAPVKTEEAGEAFFKIYNVLTLSTTGNDVEKFRLYVGESSYQSITSYGLVIDVTGRDEPSTNNFYSEAIHFSDIGWISPDVKSDELSFFLPAQLKILTAMMNVKYVVDTIENPEIVSQFFGIFREV